MPAAVQEYNLRECGHATVQGELPRFGKVCASIYAVQRMQIFEFIPVMASPVQMIIAMFGLRYLPGAFAT
jgi:hypothetical protein